MAAHDDKDAERALQEQKKLDKLRNAQIDKALQAVLATREGRELAWWLLQIGGVGTQPFATNDRITAFNCGILNVGSTILARIVDVNPTAYVRMMQEQADGRSSSGSGESNTGTGTVPDSDPYSDA